MKTLEHSWASARSGMWLKHRLTHRRRGPLPIRLKKKKKKDKLKKERKVFSFLFNWFSTVLILISPFSPPYLPPPLPHPSPWFYCLLNVLSPPLTAAPPSTPCSSHRASSTLSLHVQFIWRHHLVLFYRVFKTVFILCVWDCCVLYCTVCVCVFESKRPCHDLVPELCVCVLFISFQLKSVCVTSRRPVLSVGGTVLGPQHLEQQW